MLSASKVMHDENKAQEDRKNETDSQKEKSAGQKRQATCATIAVETTGGNSLQIVREDYRCLRQVTSERYLLCALLRFCRRLDPSSNSPEYAISSSAESR